MKLALKIALLLTVALLPLLFARGYYEVQREIAVIEGQRRAAQVSMGVALSVAVSHTWSSEGAAAALYLIEFADNLLREGVRLRYVRLADIERDDHRPLVPGDRLTPVASGHPYTVSIERDGEQRMASYVRLPFGVDVPATGALEVSSTLPARRELLWAMARRELQHVLVFGCIAALLALGIGTIAVGRPLRALIAHARAIGAGDLDRRIELRGHDELALLSKEMNSMSHQLQRARKQLQREQLARVQTLQQLRHADRLSTVGKLASGLAHELGTPMTVIRARTERMRISTTSEGIEQDAKVIDQQVERMSAIIQRLLDFGRHNKPHSKPVELASLIEEACAMLRPLASRARLELRTEAHRREPTLIECDREQLLQVLTNLLMNAIQSSEQGTITVHHGVRRVRPPATPGAPATAHAFFEVRDEGNGIAADVLPHIFDPFVTTRDVGRGSGLGLSVAYGIVNEHGGWIAVQSVEGRGSSFTVYLPLSQAAQGAVVAAPPAVGAEVDAGDDRGTEGAAHAAASDERPSPARAAIHRRASPEAVMARRRARRAAGQRDAAEHEEPR